MKTRRSLLTDIIVIFLIFNVLSIVLFTYYITSASTSTSLNYAKESMLEIVQEKSELISIRFDRLQTNIKVLGLEAENILRNEKESYTIPEDYLVREDGRVTRRMDPDKGINQQSNVLIKWESDDMDLLAKDIALTEKLDDVMGTVIDNEDVIWGYIVTRNNFLRVSPYMSLEDFFDDEHKHTEDIFYTMAGPDKDPERKPILTKPYNDYLGKGWTITCSQPIYDKNDEMYGVVCLDAGLKNMSSQLFEGFSLGKSGKIIWLDPQGNIFYHSELERNETTQGKVLEKNIFDLDEISESEIAAFKNALDGTSGTTTYTDINGKSQIMVYSKVEDMDSYLVLQMDAEDIQPSIKVDLGNIWVLILLDLVIAAVFLGILYKSFSKPMSALVRRANKISQGNYSMEDLDEGDKHTEIAQLNDAFNSMSHSITLDILAEKELQQMEKMAGIGQLSAAIVHELKNVLARIKGAAYVLELTGESTENSEELDTINSAISEAENVITTLLDFSRKTSTDKKINVESIINQILLLSNKDIISKGIDVELRSDGDSILYSDGIEALKVILQNLILNAIQASEEGGHIWIRIQKTDSEMSIGVKDDGPGIQIEPKEKIFEPFVTTKEKGNGIGLWITRRMTESLGGGINIEETEDTTEFVIRIPVGSEE